MTDARQLPSRDYVALKLAFKDLVEAAGGVTRAARITRVNASRISNYCAPQDPSQAPIDVVADLEAEVGEPFVTRALADIFGFTIVPRREAAAPAPNLGRHIGMVARETGDVLTSLGEALSDGVIDQAEADRLDAEIVQAEEALGTLRADIQRSTVARLVPRRGSAA